MSLPRTRRTSGEDGMILLSVLLTLSLVVALCGAMALAATTETLIAKNHQSAAEARAAAEGGLNHAVQVTMANLQNWQANGFASKSAAMSAMLRGPDDLAGTSARDADNGSLESYGIPRLPGRVTLGAGSYEARLFDEDDAQRGVVLSAADRARIVEDGNPSNDANTTIVVRAVGYGTGRTVAIVEAGITRLFLPAIVTNQSLVMNGRPSVSGVKGSVHSNLNLTLTGNVDIAQEATATGTYTTTGTPTIGGVSGGNFGSITLPSIRASDYRQRSDFILQADGRIVDNRSGGGKGSTLCNAEVTPKTCTKDEWGWTFQAGSGTWSLASAPPAGTYYVEGHVDISGSPGSSEAPAQLSIVATGNIDISGSPFLRPKDADVLFVTDMDLRIGGNLFVRSTHEGQMLVREQVSISGNPELAGQLLVEGAASASSLVTANSISGNPTLTYNGLNGATSLTVSGWRQVR